jgi:hypothetical protein
MRAAENQGSKSRGWGARFVVPTSFWHLNLGAISGMVRRDKLASLNRQGCEMMGYWRGAVLGILASGILVGSGVFVGSAYARCCDRFDDGCDGASETGCAMGNAMDMFFPDPCECSGGACVDPTQGNAPCGGMPGGDCGDGNTDSGEDCDDGAQNGSFMSCCTVTCSYKDSGALCEDGTFCDGLGACNGSGTCDPNATDPPCPEPQMCDEASRSCSVSAQTPVASQGVLVALAVTMLAGAVLVLRRRHHQRSI